MSIAQALVGSGAVARLSDNDKRQLTFFLNGAYGTEWGAGAEEVSGWTADDGKSFSGPDVLLPQGYQRITDYLAKTDQLARPVTIQTSRPVRRVSLAADSCVVSLDDEDITAQAVIVTVPLGVLKGAGITFSPGLPASVSQAIKRLGVGVLSKTWVRFPQAFWPATVDWHEYLGTDDASWSQWLSLAKAGQAVLLGFNAGKKAREVEAAGVDAVTDQVMPVLRSMFGGSIPDPLGVQVSSWSTDQWAQGSYSYAAVRSSRQDWLAFSKPWGERIFWAGEHTDPDYHSTVDGAILSGRRAAAGVAALLAR